MKRKIIFIILPILLISTTSVTFYLTSVYFGKYYSYLIGISFYWLFWCLLIPFLINKKNIFFYLKNEFPLFVKRNWWIIVLFLSTIIIPIFMYNTFVNIFSNPLPLVLLNIPLAILNGFCEEIFWRGFYIKEFQNSIMWGIIIPSIFFSLWHFSPQIAISHNNPFLFVVTTFPLGITNGIVAYATKSAKWTAIAHSIGGILAVVGPAASSLYLLIQ